MRYYIIDAFTKTPFGGNTAAVVLLDAGMPFPADETMRQVAAEFRFSETAFVQMHGAGEFTLRYFTPCGEVDLCGHATIATFGMMLQEGIVEHGATCLLHTQAGELHMQAGTDCSVMMQMAPARFIHDKIDTGRLHHIMAGSTAQQWPDMPPEIISTGLPDVMMPVSTVELLNSMEPDMNALARISKELNVTGVHAFALSNDGYTAHVRNFGPLYGIPEESATGTANAALTHYLLRRGIIAGKAQCRFLQGEAMGRPAVVATTLLEDGEIWVGGNSCIVARGELAIPLA